MNEADEQSKANRANAMLAAARHAWSPTAVDVQRVRRALAATLAAGAAGDAPSGTSATPKPVHGIGWWGSRALLAGALAAAGAGVGYQAGRRAERRAQDERTLLAARATRSIAATQGPFPTAGSAPPAPVVPATGAPTAAPLTTNSGPASPTTATVARRPEVHADGRGASRTVATSGPMTTESLAVEARALRNAERALRDGNPGLALAFLDALERQVPGGQLAEERDAVATVARCARGDVPFGVDRAGDFTQRHPQSLYRARVEQACAPTDSTVTGDSAGRRSRK